MLQVIRMIIPASFIKLLRTILLLLPLLLLRILFHSVLSLMLLKIGGVCVNFATSLAYIQVLSSVYPLVPLELVPALVDLSTTFIFTFIGRGFTVRYYLMPCKILSGRKLLVASRVATFECSSGVYLLMAREGRASCEFFIAARVFACKHDPSFVMRPFMLLQIGRSRKGLVTFRVVAFVGPVSSVYSLVDKARGDIHERLLTGRMTTLVDPITGMRSFMSLQMNSL